MVDYMMPGMDGLEVLRTIKQNPATEHLPVIIISALDDLSGVMRCIEHGAEDYLFKPFEPVLLSARIRAALERTRLRALERERTNELERISEELRRSNDDLNCFAYAASHDLQSPLRTIATHLQLLERRVGKKLAADELDLMRFPVEAAQRMSQLIKDLLTFSQVTTETHELEPVSCEKILNRTLADLKASIEESNATITHDPLPVVMADDSLLQQLLLNLIGNSIKYRRDEPPRIHLAAICREGVWEFAVSDNGLGIPAEHLRSVFNLFKRLHGHERPGTGLGLSICKRIVERIGGQILVESQEGVGSTFHFTIPVAQGAICDTE
jgi:light-regulated signal transduction histidine kinase (bacteriophytochrome)